MGTEQKVAVITGATAGIGLAIAKRSRVSQAWICGPAVLPMRQAVWSRHSRPIPIREPTCCCWPTPR